MQRICDAKKQLSIKELCFSNKLKHTQAYTCNHCYTLEGHWLLAEFTPEIAILLIRRQLCDWAAGLA